MSVTTESRRVLVGRREQVCNYISNRVKTSIYTPFNFLPKNLWKQFTRFSNIYFLFITALQLIPPVTSSHGVPTMIAPLTFIISVSAVKDIIEDLERHRADDKENNEPAKILNLDDTSTRTFVTTKCSDLHVGNLVKVNQNESIPADLILLACSNQNGQCYVMTANLDGESSLKPRYVPSALCTSPYRNSFSNNGDVEPTGLTSLTNIAIDCEPPNRRLDKFKGLLILPHNSEEYVELDISNILLRGTQLKDTPWVVGVVVYTGEDTKVRQNASDTPIKQSWLYKFINKITLWIVLAQIIILIIAVIVQKSAVSTQAIVKNPYIAEEAKNATALDYVWLFLAYMLLFSNFVPISLQVTIDFTRYFQSLMINRDEHMMLNDSARSSSAGIISSSSSSNLRKHVQVKSSELNEELGLIEHIFTDKTGTLTCNKMQFRSCHVDGKTYDAEQDSQIIRGDQQSFQNTIHASISGIWSSMQHETQKAAKMERFLMNLAVNNSVIPSSSNNPSNNNMEYSGMSPDERALVIAAAKYGIILKKRDANRIIVDARGEEIIFEILHVFEFTSDRKKSSIVCRTSTGNIILLCKGADSVILPALSDKNTPSKIFQAKEQMKAYCSNGLRVLCFAEREISHHVYDEWYKRYNTMKNSRTSDEEQIEKMRTELEQELMLLGVSAIEDKIQEGAPEALEKFRDAGIKVWMLTGDRPDTATNVAYSVKLISSDMRLISLADNPSMETKTAAIAFFEREISLAESSSHQKLALLVDDRAVEIIKSFNVEKVFLELCHMCESVLCARISPKQKELIIEMVRVYYPDKVTMAVGDGANDVPMIQRAHIGVGIAGEEGNQAADSSDYSIPTFRNLQRLILVHGRWMNRRTSYLTLYIFYKNVLFVLPQFVYGAFSLYSGQSTYFDSLLQLYNVCFTSLPILIFSVMDKDISAKTLLSFPKLYEDGYLHTFLNMKVFTFWIMEASIASILITLVPVYLMPLVPWTPDGQLQDIWCLGLVQYFAVIFLASLRLILDVSTHLKYVIMSIIASLGFWWFVSFVFSANIVFSWEFYGVLSHTGVICLWLCTLFCGVTGIALSFLQKAFVVSFAPYPRTICRELDLLSVDGPVAIKKGPDVVVPVNREYERY